MPDIPETDIMAVCERIPAQLVDVVPRSLNSAVISGVLSTATHFEEAGSSANQDRESVL